MIKNLSVAFLLASVCQNAFALSPVSYSLVNGDGQAHGGSYNYWDDTFNGTGTVALDGSTLSNGLGQLTDGILGGSPWFANLGNGPAQEWVGWNRPQPGFDPVINFNFGAFVHVSNVRIHVNNDHTGGVGIFSQASIFPTDSNGIPTGAPSVFITSPADVADPTPRFIDLPVNFDGQNLGLQLTADPAYQWIFVSEVQFEGVEAVPEVSTVWASAAFFGLLGCRRLFRQGKVQTSG